MRGLFAASITLGMLMFPSVVAGDMALAEPQEEVAQVVVPVYPDASTTVTMEEESIIETEPVIIEQPVVAQPGIEPVMIDVSAGGAGAMAVPYGEDGLPVIPAIGVVGTTGAMPTPGETLVGVQTTVDTTTAPLGVSSETIERSTFLTVDRLDPMADGGVMVTYSTPFRPDEVLTINPNNKPVLMTVDTDGTLMPHPSRQAAVHENEILLIDNRINLADLQDNPFPTASFNEQIVPAGQLEREVSFVPTITNQPIMQQDFQRSLPVSMNVASVVMTPTGEQVVTYDAAGNPVMIEVGMPVDGLIIETPGEIPVAFTSELPAGWRGVVIGDSILVLDNQGVIQGIVPGAAPPVAPVTP